MKFQYLSFTGLPVKLQYMAYSVLSPELFLPKTALVTPDVFFMMLLFRIGSWFTKSGVSKNAYLKIWVKKMSIRHQL